MRARTNRLGSFCLALLFLGGSSALADMTPVQTESIAPTITNWGPTTPSLSGQDPMVFSQFNSALGQLQSVNITMTYTTHDAVSMNFQVPGTIVLSSANAATPTVGPQITLEGPSGSALVSGDSPVFTYTKTYGTSAGQAFPAVFSNDPNVVPTNSPNFLTPDGQPNNTTSSFTNTKTVSITNPAQLALFTGSGTVGLPAFAVSGVSNTVPNNTSGMILTYQGVTVQLSYTYAVPEPSSMALFGLGGGGLMLVGRLRRRRVVL